MVEPLEDSTLEVVVKYQKNHWKQMYEKRSLKLKSSGLPAGENKTKSKETQNQQDKSKETQNQQFILGQQQK